MNQPERREHGVLFFNHIFRIQAPMSWCNQRRQLESKLHLSIARHSGIQTFSRRNERFGQLEAVDLQSIEPSIRADTEGGNQRDDVSETFENREALIGAVPVFDEPYIRVPKVLNKE